MCTPLAVTFQHPVRRGADERPTIASGRSLPWSSNIIGLASTPAGEAVQDSRAPGRAAASGAMTREVFARVPKKAAFSMVAGTGPSAITVPRGASSIATRAVAM